jgi:uncharacterized protein YcnI
MKLSALVLVAGMMTGLPASAHVVLAPAQATAGAYYAGAFRVSHGCSGSPTVALTVAIPAGVSVAKPQPKPGWTLRIERAPLPAPVKGEGGRSVAERVTSITWRGRLPDDEFDEFGVMMKLPDTPSTLYFPAVQTCESGENRWVEIPAPGRPRPAYPAPALRLAPNATGEAMPGMDMGHH